MAKPAGKMPNPCVPSRFCVILLATLPGYGIAEDYGVLFCLWLCKLWAACPCTCVCLVCLKGHLASLELPLLPSFPSLLWCSCLSLWEAGYFTPGTCIEVPMRLLLWTSQGKQWDLTASIGLQGKCLSHNVQDLSPLSCDWFSGTEHYSKLEDGHECFSF